MDRRSVLGAVGGLAVAASAGCLTDGLGGLGETDAPPEGDELGVEGEEPTLQRGVTHSLHVEATHATRVQFTAHCADTDAVDLQLNDAALDPEPAEVMDTYPQIWTFEDPQTVDVVVPATVATDAPHVTCAYAVTASDDTTDDPLERTFDIQITD
jgi:hypothetical protein